MLGKVLGGSLRRFRVVPVGLIRVNLGQEATAFAMKASPDQLFTEPAPSGRHVERAFPPLRAPHGDVRNGLRKGHCPCLQTSPSRS